MKGTVKELLDELKAEQTAQSDAIQRAIKEEVAKIKITEENLDANLKNLIMAKVETTSGSSSIPKVPSGGVPKETKESKIIINSMFQKIVDDLLVQNNVYLYGRAGTGKTYLAEQVAEVLCSKNGQYKKGSMVDKDGKDISDNWSYLINCSQWTSPIQIIGGFSIKGYEEGQLEKAWRYGGILILDELPKLDPNTAGLLNDALAKAGREGAIIVNGKGDKIKKHPDFMVIGTGNTDMKSVSVNFSGNNRQDYSLVDRFSGSMYKLDIDTVLEKSLVHTAVFNLGQGLRDKLPVDSIEAITLRSMLNFNRIYQLEMLREIESPIAFYPVGTTEKEVEDGTWKGGKTLKDSIMSFIESLGESRAQNMKKDARFKSIINPSIEITLDEILEQAKNQTLTLFKEEYKKLTGYDPITGKDNKGKLWNE
jgi:MoxR-like ATPase